MRALLGLLALLAACSSDATSPSDTPRSTIADAGEDGTTTMPKDDHDGGAGADGGASVTLFDGTLTPDWRMTTIKNQPGRDDPGHFDVVDGALVARPGTDLGLLWNARPTPPDFVLELEWKLSAPDDNSGVFLRFPDPESKSYDNAAWVAVDFGFEIQINEPGSPDGAPMHTTGAVYAEPDQTFTRVVARPPGDWNAYEIRAQGQVYTVSLNGAPVTRFVNAHPARGIATAPGAPSFVGIQTHTGNVAFRNIRIRAL
jgi:hypothetical protein